MEFYNDQQGNIKKILEFIMCSRNEDVPRFIDFFESKIANKELKRYKAFDQSKK